MSIHNYLATKKNRSISRPTNIVDLLKKSKLEEKKEKRHNIFGLWSLKLIEILEKDIKENNHRKVEKWANKIGVKTINMPFKEIDPFFNINTKEDLVEAEKILINNGND